MEKSIVDELRILRTQLTEVVGKADHQEVNDFLWNGLKRMQRSSKSF